MFYDRIADLYDDPARSDLSEVTAQEAVRELRVRGITPPSPILDLACGTGVITKALHDHGYCLTGVDRSEAMLKRARARFCNEDQPNWVHGDVLTYHAEGSFAAILCFGDLINHFTEPRLVSHLLKQAHTLLAPGGVFLGDTNTLNTYRSRLWNLDDERSLKGSLEFKTRAWFDPQEGLAHMELSANSWRSPEESPLYTETLLERHYERPALRNWMEAAGFATVLAREFNPAKQLEDIRPQKTFWIGVKP